MVPGAAGAGAGGSDKSVEIKVNYSDSFESLRIGFSFKPGILLK